jgi:hypothetical protein
VESFQRDPKATGAQCRVREAQPVWVPQHREKRLAFASNTALPPSSQILLSDEAWVYQMDTGRIEWVYPGEEATPIERTWSILQKADALRYHWGGRASPEDLF